MFDIIYSQIGRRWDGIKMFDIIYSQIGRRWDDKMLTILSTLRI